jgi:hypothetical protein
MNGLELFTPDSKKEAPRMVSAGKLDRNFARCMPAQLGLFASIVPNFSEKGWYLDLAPPGSGTYVLGAVDGVIKWIATEDCE